MKWILWLLASQGWALGATVFQPDGTPAANAQALPMIQHRFVHMVGTEIYRPTEDKIFRTDAEGRVAVTEETAGMWFFVHPGGWAEVELTREGETVTLQPWQSMDGKLDPWLLKSAELPKASFIRIQPAAERIKRGYTVYWSIETAIDADGFFHFPKLPEGPGVVGLLVELKNNRRILRWRDYPQAVHIPLAQPIQLGGGVGVAGKLLAKESGGLPALVTLFPKSPAPPYRGLTDEDGRFCIPGVLPGSYRLTARSDGGTSSESPWSMDFEVGAEPVDLPAIVSASGNLEWDSRTEASDDLAARVLATAATHSLGPVEKIWIGELWHPGGPYGARVTFAARPDPDHPEDQSRAVREILTLKVPGEPINKEYPAHGITGFGWRFSTEPFTEERLHQVSVRVFPLSHRVVSLPLNESVSYEEALALLRGIEEGTIEYPKPTQEKTDSGWRLSTITGSLMSPEELDQIVEIKADDDGLWRIRTRDKAFGGRIYSFEKTNEGFVSKGSGGWRS